MARIPNHLLPENLKDRKALLALEQTDTSQSRTIINRSTRGGGGGLQDPIAQPGNVGALDANPGVAGGAGVVPIVPVVGNPLEVAINEPIFRPPGRDRRRR